MIPPHLHSKLPDYLAAVGGPTVVAIAAMTNLEMWLKIVVLILTIIFIGLGIAMRVMAIRGAGEDEDE